MTRSPISAGPASREGGSAISQSASALHGAPSGTEPSGAIELLTAILRDRMNFAAKSVGQNLSAPDWECEVRLGANAIRHAIRVAPRGCFDPLLLDRLDVETSLAEQCCKANVTVKTADVRAAIIALSLQSPDRAKEVGQ